MVKSKAVFFDRDGTLNYLIDNRAPWGFNEFRFIKGATEAVKIVKDLGYMVFVVTNQPDVKDGKMAMDTLIEITKHLEMELEIDDIMIAYDRDSKLYKPNTGMLEQLIDKYDIDVESSFMIGDRWKDVLAGNRVNLTTMLLGDYDKCLYTKPDYAFGNILEACKFIGDKYD
tara:strand:- start:23357 stop:23869 length:513 start_codon:yes stop_codon:yes gene_type:complete